MQVSVDFYFEFISLIASIIFYVLKRNKIILYFIPFLLLTIVIETIGIVYINKERRNYLMYNIFTSLEFVFYAFLFYLNLRIKLLKLGILIFMPIFLLFSLLNMIFVQGFNITFNTYTFLLGSFFIVVFCCFYYYESVMPENIDLQLSKQPFLWITSGLLIFYLGSVIINSLFEYLSVNDLKVEGIKIYSYINHSLNVILYSSFCFAFYLCPNHKKISSSVSS